MNQSLRTTKKGFQRNIRGNTLVLTALAMVALFGFTALTIDVARARQERRHIQIATDAAALAGVATLTNKTETKSAMVAEAQAVAVANSLTVAEIANAGTIEWGTWTPNGTPGPGGTFTPTASLPASNAAVRVPAQRSVPLTFGQVVGVKAMTPKSHSVALISGANDVTGLIPFGVTTNVMFGVQYGQTITASWNGSGNWGKLDLCGRNESSNPVFSNDMLNGVNACSVAVGDTPDSGTGNAAVQKAFDDRLAANPIVVIPVVDDFGNGKKAVTIQGFVVAELIGQAGNGSKWSGDIKILGAFTGSGIGGPSGPPYAQNRVLVE